MQIKYDTRKVQREKQQTKSTGSGAKNEEKIKETINVDDNHIEYPLIPVNYKRENSNRLMR